MMLYPDGMEQETQSIHPGPGPKALAELLRALGDPTRLQMLALLRQRPLCVCELAARFPISQPAVSGHLRRLRSAGLVLDERRGMWVYYRLAQPLPEVARVALATLRLRDKAAAAPAGSVDCGGSAIPVDPLIPRAVPDPAAAHRPD